MIEGKFINDQLLLNKINNQLIIDKNEKTTKLRILSKNFQLLD